MTLRTKTASRIAAMTALTTLLGAFALSGSAMGQDALGGGDALDANLSTTSQRNAPTPDQGLAFRVRNLLVTGNVVGGRGFRDTVGYTAETDFRGQLGSDDLFQFRAQSAVSAPSYVLFRDQLSELQLGQDLGAMEFRRESTGSTMSTVRANEATSPFDPRMGGTELRIDRLISDVTVSEDMERWVESRPIGIGVDQEGRIVVPTTTSVLGIDSMSYDEARATAGMSVLDRARLREDYLSQYQQQVERLSGDQTRDQWRPGQQRQADGQQQDRTMTAQRPLSDVVGSRLETRFEELLTWESRVDTAETSSRVEPEFSGYEDVLKSVAERYAEGEAIDEEKAGELDDQYASIRRYLEGRGRLAPTEDDDEMQPGEDEQPTGPDRTLPGQEPDEDEADDETDDGGMFDQPTTITPGEDVTPTLESFGIVLRHDKRIATYASGDDTRFNELVRQAQQSLTTGEYFWAERRFSRALLFKRNHPLATAGKAHAQMGAGLFQPAAMTLRQLFVQYPEMIDVQFERDLLPPRTRLVQTIDSIRQRMQNNNEASQMGLLLAYIGHQWNDQSMIDEGLAAMKRDRPEDRLLPLLRTVWQTPEGESASGDDGK